MVFFSSWHTLFARCVVVLLLFTLDILQGYPGHRPPGAPGHHPPPGAPGHHPGNGPSPGEYPPPNKSAPGPGGPGEPGPGPDGHHPPPAPGKHEGPPAATWTPPVHNRPHPKVVTTSHE